MPNPNPPSCLTDAPPSGSDAVASLDTNYETHGHQGPVCVYCRRHANDVWSRWTSHYYDNDHPEEGAFAAAARMIEDSYDLTTYDFCIAGNGRIGSTEAPFLWYRKAGHDSHIVTYPKVAVKPEQKTKDEAGKSMINVGIKRDQGRLMLVVDAKEFHEELDRIGCAHNGSMYMNRPSSNVNVANSRFEMSTECLLKREYPAKFDLSGLWSNIPTTQQLNTLCESAYQAGRRILDHYQPIDINISIQKKLLK